MQKIHIRFKNINIISFLYTLQNLIRKYEEKNFSKSNMFIKIVLFSLFIKLNFINGIPPPFYNLTDHIETFYDEDFEKKVFDSNRVTFMEFYATWCGYSIYFKPHWRDFANETIGWHKHVLRIGAMDCFHIQYHQGRICQELNITIYPTLKLYHGIKFQFFLRETLI
jgi:hypothetical protein